MNTPNAVADAFAILGVLCFLATIGLLGLIALSLRADARHERRRNQERADWSAGRRPLG
jgi:hypothetical protein